MAELFQESSIGTYNQESSMDQLTTAIVNFFKFERIREFLSKAACLLAVAPTQLEIASESLARRPDPVVLHID